MNELAKSYIKYTYKSGCTQRLKVVDLNLKNVSNKIIILLFEMKLNTKANRTA